MSCPGRLTLSAPKVLARVSHANEQKHPFPPSGPNAIVLKRSTEIPLLFSSMMGSDLKVLVLDDFPKADGANTGMSHNNVNRIFVDNQFKIVAKRAGYR